MELDLTEAIEAGCRAAMEKRQHVRMDTLGTTGLDVMVSEVEAAVRAAAPIIERAVRASVRAGDPWVATIAAGAYEDES